MERRKLVVLALALASCWRSTTPEEPTDRRVPSDARRARREADAAEPDAELAGAAPADAGRPNGSTCLTVWVLALKVANPQRDLELTIAGGANHGISSSSTATLTDPAHTPARIVRVDRATTQIAVSGLTPEAIRDHPKVVLCP